MIQKYQLNQKITKILKKYCNGEYGFDNFTSKTGRFQLSAIKVTRNLLDSDTQYFEYLTNSTIDYLAQIVEEAVIYAHQDALSNTKNKLHEFIDIALDVFEATL